MLKIQELAWDRHKNVVGLNWPRGSLPSSRKLNFQWQNIYENIWVLDKSSPDKSPPTKSPPIMKSTSYLYIGIFAHILDLLYRYLWVNITFEYYFS
jgi:hypothetical protein